MSGGVGSGGEGMSESAFVGAGLSRLMKMKMIYNNTGLTVVAFGRSL
jgi:hypothetical protein